MLKLCGPFAVSSDTRPIVGPGLVPMGTQTYHWLNRETHPRFRRPNSLVLAIVRNIRGAVEQLIDSMSTVRCYHTAILGLCKLFNHITGISEEHARFHNLDCLVETLPRRLHHSDGVEIRFRFVSDVVGLVQISVKSPMIEGDVDIENIAVLKLPLVRNAMANDLVDRRAHGLWESNVVQRGRV